MKTIRTIGVIALTVIVCGLMGACSSDNEDGSENIHPIVGTWWIYDGEGDYTEITFKDDMTCIRKEYYRDTEQLGEFNFGRYMIDNHDLFIWWDDEDEVYHDTFTINGNKMTTRDGVWTRK